MSHLKLHKIKELAQRRVSTRQSWVELGPSHNHRVATWADAVLLLDDMAETIDDPMQWSEVYGNDGDVRRAYIAEFLRGMVRAGAGRHFVLAALRGDTRDALLRYRASQGEESAQTWCDQYSLSWFEPNYPARIAAKRLEGQR